MIIDFYFIFVIYIWLNLLTDESHFSYIFLPMVANLATNKIPGKNTAQKMNASLLRRVLQTKSETYVVEISVEELRNNDSQNSNIS